MYIKAQINFIRLIKMGFFSLLSRHASPDQGIKTKGKEKCF